jgi:hypothetical protein
MSENYRHKKKRNVDSIGNPIFTFLERGIERLFDRIFKPKATFAVFPYGELTSLWNNIESMESKLALIEADKLVDIVLKKAGVQGESFADRLRKVEKLVPRDLYQKMWEAHKSRNTVVHEVNHAQIDYSAELAKMKSFLITLGAFKNG